MSEPAKILRAAIEAYICGDYDNPRSHRPNPCLHGVEYYVTCEQCIDAHFMKALDAASAAEARSAETGTGSVHEDAAHAVGTPNTPP